MCVTVTGKRYVEKNRCKSRFFGGSGVHDHPTDGYSFGMGGGSHGSDLGFGLVNRAVAAAGTGGAGVPGLPGSLFDAGKRRVWATRPLAVRIYRGVFVGLTLVVTLLSVAGIVLYLVRGERGNASLDTALVVTFAMVLLWKYIGGRKRRPKALRR